MVNISVAELNRMAEDDDYRNIFGEGTFQVATPSIASLPKVIDEQTARQQQINTSLSESYMKSYQIRFYKYINTQ